MKTFKLTATKDKKTKTNTVLLQGYLNVANMTEIKKELSKSYSDTKKIDLTIDLVDEIDLSFIQLIVSFRQKCQAQKIELALKLNLIPETADLLKKAGFENTLN